MKIIFSIHKLVQQSVFVSIFGAFLMAGPAFAQQPVFEQQLANAAKSIKISITDAKFKKLAVCDLTDIDGTEQELGKFMAEQMTVELLLEKNGFSVIDRANLARILTEHKLGQLGLIKPEDIKKLGEFSGADVLLVGTITEMTGVANVTFKLLAVESGELAGAARMKFELSDDQRALKQKTLNTNKEAGDSARPRAATDKQFSAKSSKVVEKDFTFELTGFHIADDRDVTAIIKITNTSKNLVLPIGIAGTPWDFQAGQEGGRIEDSAGIDFALSEIAGFGYHNPISGDPNNLTRLEPGKSSTLTMRFKRGDRSLEKKLDYSFRVRASVRCQPLAFPVSAGDKYLPLRRMELEFEDVRPQR